MASTDYLLPGWHVPGPGQTGDRPPHPTPPGCPLASFAPIPSDPPAPCQPPQSPMSRTALPAPGHTPGLFPPLNLCPLLSPPGTPPRKHTPGPVSGNSANQTGRTFWGADSGVLADVATHSSPAPWEAGPIPNHLPYFTDSGQGPLPNFRLSLQICRGDPTKASMTPHGSQQPLTLLRGPQPVRQGPRPSHRLSRFPFFRPPPLLPHLSFPPWAESRCPLRAGMSCPLLLLRSLRLTGRLQGCWRLWPPR